MDLSNSKSKIVKFASGMFIVLDKITHVVKDNTTTSEFKWIVYLDNGNQLSINETAYNTILKYFEEVES